MAKPADVLTTAGAQAEARGDLRAAEAAYRQALALDGRHPGALNGLGVLHALVGELETAAILFRKAAQAAPRDPGPHNNLASAHRELGRTEEAIRSFRRALEIDARFRDARFNLANTLRGAGRSDEALAQYDRLLADRPDDAEARWNRGAARGLVGDLPGAFADFEARWAGARGAAPPGLPRWGGEPLAGQRIVLDADQGLGDTLQFARYVRLVREAGGRPILRAQPGLQALLQTLDGPEGFAWTDGPWPSADLWAPLASLPLLFGTTTATVPGPSPYLSAPADRRPGWTGRLGPTEALRVGLVWAGNPTHPDDRNRSAPLEPFAAALSGLKGVELCSLQVGPRAVEAEAAGLRRLDPWLTDFAETAAAMERLDLILSVDTATAHLAGALGRPAWTLLAFAGEWRWMQGRSDTPWYPGMRLYRQPAPGDWTRLAEGVARDLAALAEARLADPVRPD